MRISLSLSIIFLPLLLIACANNNTAAIQNKACNIAELPLSDENLYATWGERFSPKQLPGSSKTHIFFLAKDHTGFENIISVVKGREVLNVIQFFTWEIDEDNRQIKQKIIKTMRAEHFLGMEKTIETEEEKNREDTATAELTYFDFCNGETSHYLRLKTKDRTKILIQLARDEAPSALPYMEMWLKSQESSKQEK